MKTIEEQAREYATDLAVRNYEEVGQILAPTLLMKKVSEAFIAGAKAATRWIPVEEEIPPRDSMCIISHTSSPHPVTAMYVGGEAFCLVESGILVFKVTHWLPIPPMPEK